MEPITDSGLVVKSQSGFFTVKTVDHGLVICQIPGRLKRDRQRSDIVAAGDHVTISLNEDGTGVIESVADRTSVLSRSRPAPGEQRNLLTDREQVLVANPDQVVVVFAAAQPDPSLRKLDRFLVVTEMNELPAVICINKTDLTGADEPGDLFKVYEDIGYPVIYTSARTGEGVVELREALHNKLSVLTGSSGVGKTSLLNAVQPDLGLRVKEVSEATGKGMHTTRHTELIPLDEGGYVADTPGIRGLALFDVEPEELDAYYREIAPLVPDCQFSNCTHRNEPNCAVRAAVKDGRVSAERYESYLRLREELEDLEEGMY
ncbi:MAG: ribosome small subunit-dependent GTPase A [Chloroflexota bacterium]